MRGCAVGDRTAATPVMVTVKWCPRSHTVGFSGPNKVLLDAESAELCFGRLDCGDTSNGDHGMVSRIAGCGLH